MNPNQVHSTRTWSTDQGTAFGWNCEDCPATSTGYATEMKAKRVARIHEDPSRRQGRRAAATKN